MSYKRRKFLKHTIATSGMLLSSSSIFSHFIFKPSAITDKKCNLKNNTCHNVIAGQEIFLPSNANSGDTIFLSISSNQIKKPATIKYLDHPILGDKEDLILDSIANIKLIFCKMTGWNLA